MQLLEHLLMESLIPWKHGNTDARLPRMDKAWEIEYNQCTNSSSTILLIGYKNVSWDAETLLDISLQLLTLHFVTDYLSSQKDDAVVARKF